MSKKQCECEDDESRPVSAGLWLLGFQLDGVSWQALETQHPALAGALQEIVAGGYSPQQIRQYTMQRGLPLEWARWLEQAARYLQAGGVSMDRAA